MIERAYARKKHYFFVRSRSFVSNRFCFFLRSLILVPVRQVVIAIVVGVVVVVVVAVVVVVVVVAVVVLRGHAAVAS